MVEPQAPIFISMILRSIPNNGSPQPKAIKRNRTSMAIGLFGRTIGRVYSKSTRITLRRTRNGNLQLLQAALAVSQPFQGHGLCGMTVVMETLISIFTTYPRTLSVVLRPTQR